MTTTTPAEYHSSKQESIRSAIEVARECNLYPPGADNTLLVHQTRTFIVTANDEQFRRRFPNYKGKRQNFSCDKVQSTHFEESVRAAVTDEFTLTPREVRKQYAQQARRETNEEVDNQSKPAPNVPIRVKPAPILRRPTPTMLHRNVTATPVQNCVRCTLIKRGVTEAFVTEAHLASCAMRVDMTIKEETVSGSNHKENVLSGYDKTLAINVALSSIDNRPPHVVAESLEEKMKRDILGISNPPAIQEGHKCQSSQWLGKREKSLTCGTAKDDAISEKVLLFAPPESGKTVPPAQTHGQRLCSTGYGGPTQRERCICQ